MFYSGFVFQLDLDNGKRKLFQIVKDGDTNQDGVLDFEEFSQYLRTHEKQLKIMFSNLDRNKDGACESVHCSKQQKPKPAPLG